VAGILPHDIYIAMKSQAPLAVRVLTHNIRYAPKSLAKGEEPWPIRQPRIVNELRFHTTHCPEAFICLQEVLHGQLVDILSELNRGTDEWTSIGVARDDGKEAGEYSPLLYRPAVWDLQEWKTVWLSETPDRPSRGWDAACIRILTVGKFRHRQSRKQVIAMNTHLDHQGSRSRLEAAKIIMREVDVMSHQAGHADMPTFLTGDFNSEPTEEAYLYLKEKTPMADVQDLVPVGDRYGHQYTFTGFRPKEKLSRIDFIFIKAGTENQKQGASDLWAVKNYAVLENLYDDGVYSSDHRAVVADLELL